ncbi:unnamed protein product [Sphacelaria rigidula]
MSGGTRKNYLKSPTTKTLQDVLILYGARTDVEAETAFVVHIGENSCHQLHDFAYSFIFSRMGMRQVVQDGMSRTSDEGQRLVMVHAIAMESPLVARE